MSFIASLAPLKSVNRLLFAGADFRSGSKPAAHASLLR